MKKVALLIMAALFTFAYTTKAQKNQYVKWEQMPTNVTETSVITWLKKAMKGEAITGAQVRSNPESYSDVWGKDFYQKVLSSDKFIFTTSKGGEINYGLTSEGKGVQTGTIPAGIRIISLPDGTPVAKWGSNGCLNALMPPQTVVDNPDPDNMVVVKQPIKQPNGNVNINTNTTNPADQGKDLLLVQLGMAWRENDMLVDMNVAKDLMNSRQPCNTCGNTTVTTQPVQQPSMYQNTNYVPAAQYTSQVQYTTSAPKVPFGQTLGGQVLAEAAGEVAGTYIVRGIDRLLGRPNNYQYQNPIIPIVPNTGFQGFNQQGVVLGGGGGGIILGNGWGNTWH